MAWLVFLPTPMGQAKQAAHHSAMLDNDKNLSLDQPKNSKSRRFQNFDARLF
jgi:hypothetical protein